MFTPFRKKTFIAILVVLNLSILSIWAADWGMYIPKENSTSTNTIGATIVPGLIYIDDCFDITAGTSEDMHYLDTFVGDTSLSYSSAATKDSQKTYNKEMITAIITCNNSGTLTCSFSTTTKFGQIPYRCLIVKVSGFTKSDSEAKSVDPNDWFGTAGVNTYEVIAVLDTDSGQSTTFTLDSCECVHVVVFPFAYSNTIYFTGISPSAGTYTTRYELGYSYVFTGSSMTKTASDGMNVKGRVNKTTLIDYATYTFSFAPTDSTLSLAELVENNSSTDNVATSLNMKYTKYTNTSTMSKDEVHVTIRPYNAENYYFTRSGTVSSYFDAGLKFTNITSNSSSVSLTAGDTKVRDISSSSTIDSIDYSSSELIFTVTTTEPSASSSVYDYELNGNLAFDIYPYITSNPSSALSGDYTMTLQVELSIN